MSEIIKQIHSGWAYIALLLLAVAVINSVVGLTSKKAYTETDKKIGLFALASVHTQILIGIVLYFVSPLGLSGFNMSDSTLRLTSMEHPIINILGIVLITIGWVKHKKLSANESKFKTIAIYFGLGLVLILSRIPWALWFN